MNKALQQPSNFNNSTIIAIKTNYEFFEGITNNIEQLVKNKIISGILKIENKNTNTFEADLSILQENYLKETVKNELSKIKIKDNTLKNIINRINDNINSFDEIYTRNNRKY